MTKPMMLKRSHRLAALCSAAALFVAAPVSANEMVANSLVATGSQPAMVSDCLSDDSSSRAIRACTKFIKAAVPDAEVRSGLHVRRGLHQLALGRYDKASDDFDQAARLNGNDDFARLGQGFAAMMDQDLMTARRKFEDCANRGGTASLAEYGLGLTFQMAGQTDAAREAYQRALVLRPGWSAVTEQLRSL